MHSQSFSPSVHEELSVSGSASPQAVASSATPKIARAEITMLCITALRDGFRDGFRNFRTIISVNDVMITPFENKIWRPDASIFSSQLSSNDLSENPEFIF